LTHGKRTLVQTTIIPMRWGDMDALGHVNNTVYFRYMEQARIDWLCAQQPAGEAFGREGIVVINASCTFLEPLVFPGDVEVRMYLGDPGRTSVGSYYDICMGGRRYAEGAAKIVWIDMGSGRPKPLPDRIAAPLRAAAAD
jgi:acyl-CoA thioester hydrolase